MLQKRSRILLTNLLLISTLLSGLVLAGCGDNAGATPTPAEIFVVTSTATPAAVTSLPVASITPPATSTAVPSTQAGVTIETSNTKTAAPTLKLTPTVAPTIKSTAIPVPTSFRPAFTSTASSIALTGNVTFTFDPTLSSVEKDQIVKGIEVAQKAFGQVDPFTVSAGNSVKPPKGGGDLYAQASPGEIRVYTGKNPWIEASSADRIQTLIHEYYHLVQYYLTQVSDEDSGNEVPPDGPLWLSEGSAEYQGYRVLALNGLGSYEEARKEKVEEAADYTYPLKNIETDASKETSNTGEYVLGFLAVELLAKNYGGDKALINYLKYIGDGLDWKAAFKKAFGLTPSEFYQKFETYRKAGF